MLCKFLFGTNNVLPGTWFRTLVTGWETSQNTAPSSVQLFWKETLQLPAYLSLKKKKKFDTQEVYEDQYLVICSSAWQAVSSSVAGLPSRAHPFTDTATWSTRHVIIIDPRGPIDHSVHTRCWSSVSTEIVIIREEWSSRNWAWCRIGRQLYTKHRLVLPCYSAATQHRVHLFTAH